MSTDWAGYVPDEHDQPVEAQSGLGLPGELQYGDAPRDPAHRGFYATTPPPNAETTVASCGHTPQGVVGHCGDRECPHLAGPANEPSLPPARDVPFPDGVAVALTETDLGRIEVEAYNRGYANAQDRYRNWDKLYAAEAKLAEISTLIDSWDPNDVESLGFAAGNIRVVLDR